MKTIDIEKVLDLQGAIDLLPITMKDSFSYQQEDNGIRCVGPFFIKGRYTTLNEVKDFQDVFEFDVFAANEKLDGEEFKIVYNDYDYSLTDGVTLTLHFTVYGIRDDREENVFEAAAPEEIIPIQPLSSTEEKKEDAIDEVVDEATKEDDKAIDLSMMEELFEEKDNVITSYSFVVVKRNDSYESIASRYGVDIEALRSVNANKEIHEKSLVVLPYAK